MYKFLFFFSFYWLNDKQWNNFRSFIRATWWRKQQIMNKTIWQKKQIEIEMIEEIKIDFSVTSENDESKKKKVIFCFQSFVGSFGFDRIAGKLSQAKRWRIRCASFSLFLVSNFSIFFYFVLLLLVRSSLASNRNDWTEIGWLLCIFMTQTITMNSFFTRSWSYFSRSFAIKVISDSTDERHHVDHIFRDHCHRCLPT